MVRANHRPPQQGFSLVELLVVLSILGIMLTLAAPSYNSFIANQRARTAAQELMMTLTYARSEAVKRRADITVTAGNNDWSQGWDITANTGQADEITIRVQAALEGINIQSGGPTSITFSRNGRASNQIDFTVCDNGKLATQRQISTDLSGRASISKGGSCS